LKNVSFFKESLDFLTELNDKIATVDQPKAADLQNDKVIKYVIDNVLDKLEVNSYYAKIERLALPLREQLLRSFSGNENDAQSINENSKKLLELVTIHNPYPTQKIVLKSELEDPVIFKKSIFFNFVEQQIELLKEPQKGNVSAFISTFQNRYNNYQAVTDVPTWDSKLLEICNSMFDNFIQKAQTLKAERKISENFIELQANLKSILDNFQPQLGDKFDTLKIIHTPDDLSNYISSITTKAYKSLDTEKRQLIRFLETGDDRAENCFDKFKFDLPQKERTDFQNCINAVNNAKKSLQSKSKEFDAELAKDKLDKSALERILSERQLIFTELEAKYKVSAIRDLLINRKAFNDPFKDPDSRLENTVLEIDDAMKTAKEEDLLGHFINLSTILPLTITDLKYYNDQAKLRIKNHLKKLIEADFEKFKDSKDPSLFTTSLNYLKSVTDFDKEIELLPKEYTLDLFGFIDYGISCISSYIVQYYCLALLASKERLLNEIFDDTEKQENINSGPEVFKTKLSTKFEELIKNRIAMGSKERDAYGNKTKGNEKINVYTALLGKQAFDFPILLEDNVDSLIDRFLQIKINFLKDAIAKRIDLIGNLKLDRKNTFLLNYCILEQLQPVLKSLIACTSPKISIDPDYSNFDIIKTQIVDLFMKVFPSLARRVINSELSIHDDSLVEARALISSSYFAHFHSINFISQFEVSTTNGLKLYLKALEQKFDLDENMTQLISCFIDLPTLKDTSLIPTIYKVVKNGFKAPPSEDLKNKYGDLTSENFFAIAKDHALSKLFTTFKNSLEVGTLLEVKPFFNRIKAVCQYCIPSIGISKAVCDSASFSTKSGITKEHVSDEISFLSYFAISAVENINQKLKSVNWVASLLLGSENSKEILQVGESIKACKTLNNQPLATSLGLAMDAMLFAIMNPKNRVKGPIKTEDDYLRSRNQARLSYLGAPMSVFSKLNSDEIVKILNEYVNKGYPWANPTEWLSFLTGQEVKVVDESSINALFTNEGVVEKLSVNVFDSLTESINYCYAADDTTKQAISSNVLYFLRRIYDGFFTKQNFKLSDLSMLYKCFLTKSGPFDELKKVVFEKLKSYLGEPFDDFLKRVKSIALFLNQDCNRKNDLRNLGTQLLCIHEIMYELSNPSYTLSMADGKILVKLSNVDPEFIDLAGAKKFYGKYTLTEFKNALKVFEDLNEQTKDITLLIADIEKNPDLFAEEWPEFIQTQLAPIPPDRKKLLLTTIMQQAIKAGEIGKKDHTMDTIINFFGNNGVNTLELFNEFVKTIAKMQQDILANTGKISIVISVISSDKEKLELDFQTISYILHSKLYADKPLTDELLPLKDGSSLSESVYLGVKYILLRDIKKIIIESKGNYKAAAIELIKQFLDARKILKAKASDEKPPEAVLTDLCNQWYNPNNLCYYLSSIVVKQKGGDITTFKFSADFEKDVNSYLAFKKCSTIDIKFRLFQGIKTVEDAKNAVIRVIIGDNLGFFGKFVKFSKERADCIGLEKVYQDLFKMIQDASCFVANNTTNIDLQVTEPPDFITLREPRETYEKDLNPIELFKCNIAKKYVMNLEDSFLFPTLEKNISKDEIDVYFKAFNKIIVKDDSTKTGVDNADILVNFYKNRLDKYLADLVDSCINTYLNEETVKTVKIFKSKENPFVLDFFIQMLNHMLNSNRSIRDLYLEALLKSVEARIEVYLEKNHSTYLKIIKDQASLNSDQKSLIDQAARSFDPKSLEQAKKDLEKNLELEIKKFQDLVSTASSSSDLPGEGSYSYSKNRIVDRFNGLYWQVSHEIEKFESDFSSDFGHIVEKYRLYREACRILSIPLDQKANEPPVGFWSSIEELRKLLVDDLFKQLCDSITELKTTLKDKISPPQSVSANTEDPLTIFKKLIVGPVGKEGIKKFLETKEINDLVIESIKEPRYYINRVIKSCLAGYESLKQPDEPPEVSFVKNVAFLSGLGLEPIDDDIIDMNDFLSGRNPVRLLFKTWVNYDSPHLAKLYHKYYRYLSANKQLRMSSNFERILFEKLFHVPDDKKERKTFLKFLHKLFSSNDPFEVLVKSNNQKLSDKLFDDFVKCSVEKVKPTFLKSKNLDSLSSEELLKDFHFMLLYIRDSFKSSSNILYLTLTPLNKFLYDRNISGYSKGEKEIFNRFDEICSQLLKRESICLELDNQEKGLGEKYVKFAKFFQNGFRYYNEGASLAQKFKDLFPNFHNFLDPKGSILTRSKAEVEFHYSESSETKTDSSKSKTDTFDSRDLSKLGDLEDDKLKEMLTIVETKIGLINLFAINNKIVFVLFENYRSKQKYFVAQPDEILNIATVESYKKCFEVLAAIIKLFLYFPDLNIDIDNLIYSKFLHQCAVSSASRLVYFPDFYEIGKQILNNLLEQIFKRDVLRIKNFKPLVQFYNSFFFLYDHFVLNYNSIINDPNIKKLKDESPKVYPAAAKVFKELYLTPFFEKYLEEFFNLLVHYNKASSKFPLTQDIFGSLRNNFSVFKRGCDVYEDCKKLYELKPSAYLLKSYLRLVPFFGILPRLEDFWKHKKVSFWGFKEKLSLEEKAHVISVNNEIQKWHKKDPLLTWVDKKLNHVIDDFATIFDAMYLKDTDTSYEISVSPMKRFEIKSSNSRREDLCALFTNYYLAISKASHLKEPSDLKDPSKSLEYFKINFQEFLTEFLYLYIESKPMEEIIFTGDNPLKTPTPKKV
jgi:hypothetical protein